MAEKRFNCSCRHAWTDADHWARSLEARKACQRQWMISIGDKKTYRHILRMGLALLIPVGTWRFCAPWKEKREWTGDEQVAWRCLPPCWCIDAPENLKSSSATEVQIGGTQYKHHVGQVDSWKSLRDLITFRHNRWEDFHLKDRYVRSDEGCQLLIQGYESVGDEKEKGCKKLRFGEEGFWEDTFLCQKMLLRKHFSCCESSVPGIGWPCRNSECDVSESHFVVAVKDIPGRLWRTSWWWKSVRKMMRQLCREGQCK